MTKFGTGRASAVFVLVAAAVAATAAAGRGAGARAEDAAPAAYNARDGRWGAGTTRTGR